MIDEKKIEEAQESIFEDKFLNNEVEVLNYDNGDADPVYTGNQIKEAIGLGAHWAINEFLKGLWHDAEEEPRNDYSDILVIREKPHRPTTISLQLMLEDIKDNDTSYKDEWNRVCRKLHITKYCYIDYLLKYKGGSDD